MAALMVENPEPNTNSLAPRTAFLGSSHRKVQTQPSIHILSSKLINKIAAGEVVERPASVVKELVENALDAGASQIEVHVEKGGMHEIRIIDNGQGMTSEEMALAIRSHATSKIRSESDLDQIRTFGFRGEALAAISQVCQFQMISRVNAAVSGNRLIRNDVQGTQIQETGAPLGTDISVKDLFYNVPARKKFLRKPATEFGHIQEVFIRLALFQKNRGFRLYHNGRKTFQISPQTELLARIGQFMRLDGDLIEISITSALIQLKGYISPAHGVYGNRERFLTFVNHRHIRDRSLNHALHTAYRELAPAGTFPLVVLNLEISPTQVDVNVHPTKTEIRFAQPNAVYQFVLNALRKTLSQTVRSNSPKQVSTEQSYRQRIQGAVDASLSRDSFSLPIAMVKESIQGQNKLFKRGPFSRLRVIGQWRESYILCEDPSREDPNLILIDQHAAHERIGYERYKKAYKDGKLSAQNLLIPEQMEVTALEYGLLEEYLPHLERLAFDIELFGGKTILIRTTPSLMGKTNLKNLMRHVLQDLARYGQSQNIEDVLDRLLMTFSCHMMVRANHHLEIPEMAALLQQLDEIDFSVKCPHGRPVQITFSLTEIERRFGRT